MREHYGFPAFLSAILPGCGQLIKGQFGKAFLIWIGFALVFIARWLVGYVLVMQGGGPDIINYDEPIKKIAEIVIPLSDILKILLSFVLWIFQVKDAYLSELKNP